MTDQFSIFQRRFGDARPGLRLIAAEDAAIPVTVLRADVLAQEKKELPITEEFTLRFVSLGVTQTDEIAAYLGLEPGHVVDAAAAQLSENHLRRRDEDGTLTLTPLGVEVSRTLAATQPVLRQLPVAFDRLTWALADYPERMLVSKRDAEEAGMLLLPAEKNARIGLDDVTPSGFNALLRRDRLQVLRIHKVSISKYRYLPVKLLIYGDQARKEIELALCIDDDLAVEHGLALARIEAVSRLGITLGEAEPRPVLDDELESHRTAEPVDQPGEPSASDEAGTSGGFTSQVRSVSVFEHADLLARALSSSTSRLLIVSPWVRSAVVTTDFLAHLEQRLRSGVQVTIAHGYGDDDSGSDEFALRRLGNLANRYEKFDLVRVKNTHAKILIFDSHWVSTSFNWLSFRGDPERTYRMEEGTLVSIPSRVDAEYSRYMDLVQAQRADLQA